jgi:hypothetical protein
MKKTNAQSVAEIRRKVDLILNENRKDNDNIRFILNLIKDIASEALRAVRFNSDHDRDQLIRSMKRMTQVIENVTKDYKEVKSLIDIILNNGVNSLKNLVDELNKSVQSKDWTKLETDLTKFVDIIKDLLEKYKPETVNKDDFPPGYW